VVRLLGISLLLVLCISSQVKGANAENQIPIRGDRLSGVVLPVRPRANDITISALRADAWTVDDTKRLLLNKNVNITIGAYIFDAEQAVVWINRMPTDAGVVTQIAIFMPKFAKSAKLGGLGAEGENLFVVGSTRGSVSLDVAYLSPKRPSSHSSLLTKAGLRLKEYIWKLETTPSQLSNYPQINSARASNEQTENTFRDAPESAQQREWLQPASGVLSIAADLVELKTGATENIVTLSGKVNLQLRSKEGLNDMQLTAARGILFLDAGSVRDIASGTVDMSQVHGVYLEGNVVANANNGNYLVRAPQMYYDFDTGKAVMLESVLRTYVKNGTIPVYVRAKELQQVSSNQWIANSVQASTSSFATPDIAVGAAKMTITQQENGDAYVVSEHNTVRLGGTPIMYWPKYSGEIAKIPLRGVNLGHQDTKGQMIETKWKLFSLLGVREPENVSAELLVDYYTKRGYGVGTDFNYTFGKNVGFLNLYLLDDSGEEKTSSGRTLDVTETTRGYALLENEAKVSPNWTIQTQLSYISDPTFISVWRQSDYRNHDEYETSIYAKYQKENVGFTALAKYDLNQFISTSSLLASRQYKVDKAPELGYYRYADTFFNGAVNWSSESRITRERMVFQEGTPSELGLRNSAFAFPDGTILGTDDLISAPLRSDGLTQDYQNRFVTRHEFTMPFQFGAVKVAPFASIQTQWGIENDEVLGQESNYWTRTVGVRATTQFQRIHNNVDNDLLDLHRLRHVIEPYLTVWNGDSNIDPMQIRQYDAQVDNIATGTAIWFGVKNKLQTWRGGPGRWYEVDWLTIDTAFLFASNDATQRYDNPQFFNWRPEYSSLADAFIASGTWQFSDSIAFVGNGTWETENGTFSRGSIGAELDHGKDVRTYIEYREIGNSGDQFLTLGMNYNLSKRYSFNFAPSWNFAIDDLQSLKFNVTRHYPDFNLIGLINYNEIQDETTYGFKLNLLRY
jgi:hypothetical protein